MSTKQIALNWEIMTNPESIVARNASRDTPTSYERYVVISDGSSWLAAFERRSGDELHVDRVAAGGLANCLRACEVHAAHPPILAANPAGSQ